MKKFMTLAIAIMLAVVLVACDSETSGTSSVTVASTTTVSTISTTTPSTTTSVLTTSSKIELAIPGELEVIDNVVSFQIVDNAVKYQLQVRNVVDNTTNCYYVNPDFNLRLILPDGNYGFSIRAIGNQDYADSALSTEILAQIADPDLTSSLEGTELENYNYLNWSGRTYYNETEQSVEFYFTASGFDVSFYGTELNATFLASNTSITGKQPHLMVFVDGEENPLEGATLVLDNPEKTYTLASGLVEGFHKVKVMKRSEAIDSDTALKAISTDGYFTNPDPDKEIKFQFIAASSSTGYGNLSLSTTESKTTVNSHGLLGFPYLASYMMNAECSIFAASGWGVTRGWNTNGDINTVENIPNAYDYIGIDAGNKVLTSLGRWNHTDYVPDVIVVNLGTNDFNASGYNAMDDAEKLALENRFVEDYTAFILRLNNYHPDAIIIVAYGLMGESLTLKPVTEQVVANANVVTDKVHIFQMEAAGSNGIPYGVGYHPTVQTHINVAEALVAKIETLTDFIKIRDNITWD